MDSADPIAATYQRIFPSLFKPFAAMPPDLQKHIRYPEDLFQIQARLYQTYHLEAADVFYNREDLWQFPRQPGGDGTAMTEPYYIIMRTALLITVLVTHNPTRTSHQYFRRPTPSCGAACSKPALPLLVRR
jgi:uncharacterized membrane protein (UPF0182 family)